MNGYGYYYLHTNGDLIFKRFEPERDSPFVRRVWRVAIDDRGTAWLLLIEALALGANRVRIDELAQKWGVNDNDAPNFVKHATDSSGKKMFRLSKDGDRWCATFHDFVNLQELQVGFGDTCLEAFADLARPGLLEKCGGLQT